MLRNPDSVSWRGTQITSTVKSWRDMYDNGNYLCWNGNSLKYKYSDFQSADNRDGSNIGDYVYDGTSYPGLGNTYQTFIRTSSMMLIATVESQGTFSVTGELWVQMEVVMFTSTSTRVRVGEDFERAFKTLEMIRASII